MKPLTWKEKETLEFVEAYIKENGCPPTYRVIQNHFKLKSNCAAHARCRKFRDKMKVNTGNTIKGEWMRVRIDFEVPKARYNEVSEILNKTINKILNP